MEGSKLEWADAGIYAIRNTATGERYVGSTRVFAQRLAEHVTLLRQGKHDCARLQAAWNTHGAKAFAFDVLERVQDAATLLEREQAWLDRLRPAYNGRLKIWVPKHTRPLRPAAAPVAKASDVFVPYLRSWRADKGMTQEELAAAADVARNTVLRAEAGGAVNVRTLAKLARALGISVHELRHTNPETK